MASKMTGKTMAKNVSLSVIVQLVSLSVSFILNFAIPKFIDEYQYSYWQSFVLYLGYVGIMHFGLLDGIVLRYSQYDFNELDKKTFRSQFLVLLCSTSFFAVMGIIYSVIFSEGISRSTIIFVSLGIITKNIFAYNSYLFQITNRIKNYARLVIFQRVTYGIFVIILLLFRVNRFEWYCIADLAGDLVGIGIAAFSNNGMYFGKALSILKSIDEWKKNVSSGILLMLANWSSILLLGSAKLIVQWHWDELIFGKVAFSFSVSNLFLTFVTAISIVLFPALKRMDKQNLPNVYKKIRGAISPVLLISLLFYFPGSKIISSVLPNYRESLVYLGVLLPIIVFTSKVNLLTNNYLKAYREEKKMLIVNFISIAIAFSMFFVCAYLFDCLDAVLICIVIAVALNSILSEIIVMKIICIKLYKDIVAEVVLAGVFILATSVFSRLIAFCVYLIALIIYFIIFRKELEGLFYTLNNSIKGGNKADHQK